MKPEEIKSQLKIEKAELKRLESIRENMEIMSHYDKEDKLYTAQELRKKIAEESRGEKFKLKSGIDGLDKIIGDFREGQLVIISAPTGQGKTTFCQTLTKNFAGQGVHSTWLSYEVGAEEFLEKMDESVNFAMPAIHEHNSLKWVEFRMVEGMGKYGTKVLFIDHLHFLLEMQKMAEAKSISLLIGMMMRELKKLALKYGTIIFLVSHMKKTIADKEPDIDDLRDSSFVAQESDIVMFLSRKKEGGESTNQAVLGVAKNRRTGNLGRVTLELKDKQFKEVEFKNNQQKQFDEL